MTTQEATNMSNIYGKYYVKIDPDLGLHSPECIGSISSFWTNDIKYEENGTITIEPINSYGNSKWPLSVNIHITQCVIFKMKNS